MVGSVVGIDEKYSLGECSHGCFCNALKITVEFRRWEHFHLHKFYKCYDKLPSPWIRRGLLNFGASERKTVNCASDMFSQRSQFYKEVFKQLCEAA